MPNADLVYVHYRNLISVILIFSISLKIILIFVKINNVNFNFNIYYFKSILYIEYYILIQLYIELVILLFSIYTDSAFCNKSSSHLVITGVI